MHKAEREIGDANRISQRSTRKLFFLFLVLCTLAISVILIVIFILLPDNEKKFLL
jgi:hypothetical protein